MSIRKVVCHLTTAHPANDGRIYYRECLSLSMKSNYKVILLANGTLPEPKEVFHINLGVIPGNRVTRIFRSQFLGLKAILKVKADLWHIHDPELLICASILILLRKKIIWDAHEDYFLQFERKVHYRSYMPIFLDVLIGRFVITLLKFVDRNAAAVVCATKSIESKYTNSNKVIVGNEARLEEFRECHPTFFNNKILFTGSTDYSQSFRENVLAISRFPELCLTVAGRFKDDSDWKFAKEILGSRIQHLGWLNRKELAKAISNSKLGLLTYNDAPTNETNSPNKKFEFSAGGLPCIATPTQANIEWNKESGGAFLANGFGTEDIALAIEKAISSIGEWEKCSNSTRNWSESFGNWSISENRLLELYRKLE